MASSIEEQLCNSIANIDKNILITTLLQENESVAFYVRPDVPMPDDADIPNMIARSQIMAGIPEADKGYLGKVRYVKVSKEDADVFLFSIQPRRAFVVVILRPYDENQIVDDILHKVVDKLK
jgi:hypothetical protein